MYFGRMLGNKIFKQEQPLIAHVQNCLVCAEGRHNFLWTSEKEKRKSRPFSGFKPTNGSPQMTLILSARVYVACKCMRVWLKLVFKFQDSSGQRETDCVRVRVQLTIHGETSFYSFLFAKRPFTLWRQRIASHHTSFFSCPQMFVYGSVSGHISSRMRTTPSSKFGSPWRLFTPCLTAEGRLKIT